MLQLQGRIGRLTKCVTEEGRKRRNEGGKDGREETKTDRRSKERKKEKSTERNNERNKGEEKKRKKGNRAKKRKNSFLKGKTKSPKRKAQLEPTGTQTDCMQLHKTEELERDSERDRAICQ